jgi:hypothetical protein
MSQRGLGAFLDGPTDAFGPSDLQQEKLECLLQ